MAFGAGEDGDVAGHLLEERRELGEFTGGPVGGSDGFLLGLHRIECRLEASVSLRRGVRRGREDRAVASLEGGARRGHRDFGHVDMPLEAGGPADEDGHSAVEVDGHRFAGHDGGELRAAAL